MLPKKKSDLSAVIQQDKKEEVPINQKIRRTKDDVKKIFLDNYLRKNKLDPDDEKIKEAGLTEPLNALVNALSERELANSKRMSKVIGQKVKFRDLFAAESKEGASEDETEEDEVKGKETESLKVLKEIERKKAVEKFLPVILKEFEDEKLSSNDVYDKLQKVYREEKEDVRREDFEKRLEEAFAIAYPKLFRERIRRQERQRLYEEDNPKPGGLSSSSHSKDRENSRVPRHGVSKSIKDWYKKS